MRITVFTPTYNRAYIIENLYRSLQCQTFRDFEWLIVDDGSSDNTKDIVSIWQQEGNDFPIRYYKKENGGKCRAINYGVDLAEGELFFNVDSDDYLLNDALEKIDRWEQSLPKNGKFCGVVGNLGTSPTETPNTPWPEPYRDASLLERYPEACEHPIDGERAWVFYTELQKKYKYPEFEGENFITPAVTWNRMANDGYLVRIYDDIIWVYEYQPDGLTASGSSRFINRPQGHGLWLREKAEFLNYSFKDKFMMWYSFYCDHAHHLKLIEIADYIGAPLPVMWCIWGIRRVERFDKVMKNIIITGGGMMNKGAQAMTLIAIHELRKRFPNHLVFLYSPTDLANTHINKHNFDFEFTGWYPLKFSYCQNNVLSRLLILLRNRSELLEAERIYQNTEFILDVSGYALGSNWSSKICNDFLDVLEFAKGFKIPVYLMPQSFGPFDFGPEHPGIDKRCRRLLPACKAILAREKEGYDALVNTYGLTNVRLAPDLVLNNTGIDLKNIFKEVPKFNLPEIAPESIAIIPNGRNLSVGDGEEVLKLYETAIHKGLEQGKNVYLLHHATSDATICEMLKERFEGNEKVVLLSQEFSCLEFNELVKGFDYLVASRFHSIVHAYKNGIPCVILGWAKKYEDLSLQFGQGDYLLDVRESVGASDLCAIMDRMNLDKELESQKIKASLADVQKENVFDILNEK